MEQLSEQSDSPVASRQQTSYWYQAATLAERIASYSAQDTARMLSERSRREKAEKTLQHWKAQKPFDKGSFFADRLAMDGITEEDLLALLQESLDALEKRLGHPAPPNWVTDLSDVLQTDSPHLPLMEEEQKKVFQGSAILQPFASLLYKHVMRLQAGIKVLVQEYSVLPFDPQTICALLLPNLFQQIEPQISKTLVLELNVARLRGHLHGETPQERFQDYLCQLSQREHMLAFLEEYNVLARQILRSNELWADVSLTFLQRLCLDWQEILAVLGPEQEVGVLTSIAGGAGDTHRSGQSVLILTFSSGWQLVYKPRTLAVDVHFQELLTWLNAQGAHPFFSPLKLLNRADYGWTECISVRDCTSEEEVRRFYQRQGEYLALLYVLEAGDFHQENVLAAGEHPLLVDLEALLHPRKNRGNGSTSLAQQALEHSVLRVGLLPWRFLANDEDEGLAIGGLARQLEGQLSPRPISQWEEAGTDEMRLVRKRVELGRSYNCPRLHNQDVQPLDYIEHIINGFVTLYRLLVANRDTLLRNWLPRFFGDEVRFIARNTYLYDLLLQESFHPNLLRDALKRERFFDHLWKEVEFQPALARLISAERADLLQGDIPLFTTHPGSRDLWTSRGEYLPAFFEASSLELVRERLQQLGEADLLRQTWLIRASFACIAEEQVSTDLDQSERSAPPLDTDLLLAEARAIGEKLYTSTFQDEKQVDWLSISLVKEHEWQITSAGLDLYNGLPGILLFLGYLGLVTKEARYTDLAQAGLTTLRGQIRQNQEILEKMGIGAFDGLGSCIYLFSHLATLWQEPSLLQEAEELVQHLPAMMKKDEQYNLVYGAAGCLASLLSLYDVTPLPQVLMMAIHCGEHLLAHSPFTSEGVRLRTRQSNFLRSGFSHGATGIAWSLLRLTAITGEERFRQTALQILAYERGLFSPERRNWRDGGRLPDEPAAPDSHHAQEKESYGMSWSYGAPGIALGRLISLPYLDDITTRSELEMALETTIAEGFGYSHRQVGSNHSLAHGDCGNLETVLLARQILRTPQLHEHLARLVAQVVKSMSRDGWTIGVPLNVETPGLMCGLAGIGYQCLRLVEPERVPSILSLASPPKLWCGSC